MLIASIWATVGQHALAFLLGVAVGLVASSRYRIVRVKDPPS